MKTEHTTLEIRGMKQPGPSAKARDMYSQAYHPALPWARNLRCQDYQSIMFPFGETDLKPRNPGRREQSEVTQAMA